MRQIISSALVLIASLFVAAPAFAQEEQKVPEAKEAKFTPGDDIWKWKKRFMFSYTTGKLDLKRRYGGEISSRWGLSIKSGRNIYLHRGPIGGFLKFGLNIDVDVNYMNFAKGTGRLYDIWSDYDDDNAPTLGRHYLTAGLALGPTATFAPFYARPTAVWPDSSFARIST